MCISYYTGSVCVTNHVRVTLKKAGHGLSDEILFHLQKWVSEFECSTFFFIPPDRLLNCILRTVEES